MYESRDANPYYQSADLDLDAARAEWERQGEPPAEAPTHTWYVRTSGTVWHAVSLPLKDEAVEHRVGMPDVTKVRARCGLVVERRDRWSWGDTYYGGEPLPVCQRCRKANGL